MTNHTAAAAYLLIAAVIPTSAIAESIVIQWNDLALKTISKTATNPPQATRALSMMHTAIYDAWANYDEKALGSRLGGSNRRPPAERTDANKEQAIAYATYRVLVYLFPEDEKWMATEARKRGVDPDKNATDPSTPAGVGNAAAAAVIEFRRHDGANQHGDEIGSDGKPYSDWTYYRCVNTPDRLIDPDCWQPIPFDDGKGGTVVLGFLTPHWYRV